MLNKTISFWSNTRPQYFVAAGVAWICLCSISANAQTGATTKGAKPAWRLLTAKEGRSIVSAAWAEEQPTTGTQDCSHLIHAVYKKAGFEYPYDSSFELYEGNEYFVRVKFPHSGDLIVWPGHVGIVVDPLLHSFYSLVRTGLEEQDYEGTYWKSRGQPRFYRYKLQTGRVLDAAKVAAESTTLIKSVKKRDETGGLLKSAPSSDSEENTVLTNASKTASKRSARVMGPHAPTELTETTTKFQIPSRIVVGPGSRPPTPSEVGESVSELSNAAGHVLRTDDPLKVQLPVVVVEQFKVERVDIKRDHGWALVMIDSKVSISGGTAQPKPQREQVRWELRRTESGWEAVAPPDKTYVQHDVVVKNLAAQLARLTESEHASARQEEVLRQESMLANLLSGLIESK